MSPRNHGAASLVKESSRPFTVVVEGNIGSGKTSFLDYFSKFEDVETLTEPVDKWRNFRGHNLLELMYKDPCKYSLLFQSYVQLTMLDHHVKPSTAKVKIMERSLFSARYCFVENLVKKEFMDSAEYAVISEWYDWMFEKLDLNVDLIVYLRTSPIIANARVQKRSRSEENQIPFEYLQGVHDLHEQWLKKGKFPIPAKVLELDANADPATLLEEIKRVQEQIIPGVSKLVKKSRPMEYPESVLALADSQPIAVSSQI